MPPARSGGFRITWVLPDVLALGPAPRHEHHLLRLKEAGIAAVLSLCSIEEAPPPADLSQRFQCGRIVLPDHRSDRSLQLSELTQALDLLQQLRQSGAVFVHCVAAMERSPLLCLAWLITQHHLSPTEALDYLMQTHPGTNPLPRQLHLLRWLTPGQADPELQP